MNCTEYGSRRVNIFLFVEKEKKKKKRDHIENTLFQISKDDFL
jgi:hypothetical protein